MKKNTGHMTTKKKNKPNIRNLCCIGSMISTKCAVSHVVMSDDMQLKRYKLLFTRIHYIQISSICNKQAQTDTANRPHCAYARMFESNRIECIWLLHAHIKIMKERIKERERGGGGSKKAAQVLGRRTS